MTTTLVAAVVATGVAFGVVTSQQSAGTETVSQSVSYDGN